MKTYTRFCAYLKRNSRHSLSVYLSLYLWLYSPFVGPWPLFQFYNHIYTVGRTPWTGDQPIARPLPTHRTTQTQNKRTQTSMLRVGFEPMISAFEREKTVHALDCAATEIGCLHVYRSDRVPKDVAYKTKTDVQCPIQFCRKSCGILYSYMEETQMLLYAYISQFYCN
jgi:hypothetical protein